MMNSMKAKAQQIDYALLIGIFLLVGIGLVMVYSASFYTLMVRKHESPETYLISGLVYAMMGIVVMFVVSFIDYRFIRRFTGLILIISVVLGVYTLIKGVELNGAKRWIDIFGITIMPSEITKVAVLMTTASYVAGMGKRMKRFSHFAAALVVICALSSTTMLQPNLSTTALTVMLGISILFLSECRIHHFIILFTASLAAIGGLIAIAPYRAQRIVIFLASLFDRSYVFDGERLQIMYSIYAVGSGGIKGVGLGMGELKNLRLPEPYNDFVFSIISEEFGLIGALIVMLLFAFVIYRIFYIASQAIDQYGFYMAAGIGILVSYQVIINIGVATNLLPTTGIPLPFVSKGGTSLLIMMGLMGIVLNISTHLSRPELNRSNIHLSEKNQSINDKLEYEDLR